jgi:methionine-rich copper-binding protein CopC
MHLIESAPAAHSIVSGDSTEFSVRFDRPVDHIHSLLQIQRGDELVETLHPSLRSAAQVLFATAPTLPPGDYNLHWEVIGMSEKENAKGDIPFTVRQ